MLLSNAEQIDFLKSALDELISKSPKKTKPTTKELSCEICNKNFISKSGLTRHIKAKHGEPKIPDFNLFSGQEEEACAVAPVDINKNKSKSNENEIKSELCPELKSNIVNNNEGSPKDIDSNDTDNEITFIDEGAIRKQEKQLIALLVSEKLENYQLKQEEEESEKNRFLKINKFYRDTKNDQVFKYDDNDYPLVSTAAGKFMLTLSFDQISNEDPDFLEYNDFGLIEINKKAKECFNSDNDEGPYPGDQYEPSNDHDAEHEDHEDCDNHNCNNDEGPDPGNHHEPGNDHDAEYDDHDDHDHSVHDDKDPDYILHSELPGGEFCGFAEIIERNMQQYF